MLIRKVDIPIKKLNSLGFHSHCEKLTVNPSDDKAIA